MIKIKVFALILLICSSSAAQKKIEIRNLSSSFSKAENRLIRDDEFRSKVESALKSSRSTISEKKLTALLKEIDIRLASDDNTKKLLMQLVGEFENYSLKFRRQLLTTFITILPDRHGIVNSIFESTTSPTIFSIAGIDLLRENQISASNMQSVLIKRFSSFQEDAILSNFSKFILNLPAVQTPPLNKLLAGKFQENKTVIFAFFRHDRKIPGISIIRLPDGRFMREENGGLFSVRQLALSVNNLPWFLTDGNTPQGIYSIVGWYITPTKSIGPTPNILTRMPFEVSVPVYFHNESGQTIWNITEYLGLLPEEWKNYEPLHRAYLAGKLGRKLIIMHGSTDDPKYYSNQPYAPLSPSKGCITSTEIWEPISGRCVKSDQAKLMNAYFSTGERRGFLVVVELDNSEQDVTVEEITPFIPEFSNQ